MSQRRAVLIGTGIPALLVVLLLVWGTVRSGGESGRPGINDNFGIVPVGIDPFGDFELTTLAGDTIHLSDFRGKVVLVDFWSSWCAPCKAEGPDMASAYLAWRNRGVEFIGVAIWDDRGPVEDFILRNRIQYINGIDEKGFAAIEFGVSGIPEKFLVMPDGEIVKKIIGPNSRANLDAILTEATEQAFATTSAR